jgi:hypothetical protein
MGLSAQGFSVSEWKPTDADYEWEIERIDLDALEVDLRLLSPINPRTIHMITFDIADYHDWNIGDHVAIDPGPMSQTREIEKAMGMRMSEEDYTLFNKRTGESVPIFPFSFSFVLSRAGCALQQREHTHCKTSSASCLLTEMAAHSLFSCRI